MFYGCKWLPMLDLVRFYRCSSFSRAQMRKEHKFEHGIDAHQLKFIASIALKLIHANGFAPITQINVGWEVASYFFNFFFRKIIISFTLHLTFLQETNDVFGWYNFGRIEREKDRGEQEFHLLDIEENGMERGMGFFSLPGPHSPHIIFEWLLLLFFTIWKLELLFCFYAIMICTYRISYDFNITLFAYALLFSLLLI